MIQICKYHTLEKNPQNSMAHIAGATMTCHKKQTNGWTDSQTMAVFNRSCQYLLQLNKTQTG